MDTTLKDIDSYIAAQSAEDKTVLEKIRHTIQKAAPKAEETISYAMPAFRFYGMIIYFAVFKNHYSIFVPTVTGFFKEELKPYKTSKATIQFPKNKAVPYSLITKIVKYAAKVNLEKESLKNKKK